jgi:shikimate kinase/3-dehydroquinate synthase
MAKVRAEDAAGGRVRGDARPASRKIVLVGFMGAGKSTAARRASELSGLEAVDTDLLLEAELGETIASFFERNGEPAFREREEALVLDLLERPDPAVIALGGGALERERVREKLRDHICVHLEIDAGHAWTRSEGPERPLARDRDSFLRLHAKRLPLYESAARAVLPPLEGAALDRALETCLGFAKAPVPSSVRMVWAPTREGGYPVYAGVGALGATGALWPGRARSFVLADEKVWPLHGAHLGAALPGAAAPVEIVTVPPGERQKTLATAERVLRSFAQAGMERSDTLVALGGGVVGDLAGFCAAVYQRGVGHVQVPTTLVAQVDSAYGGKTGVDLPEAKNYVGAFHQPEAVFTDPSLLATLPEAELRAGMAEVVKTALIAGGTLWERVRELPPPVEALATAREPLREVIEGCLRTKLAVVAEDELDQGARAALNLGHTFAHALEAATRYDVYRHGEAVGIGLLVALTLSEWELGLDSSLRQEVADLLRRHGLPDRFGGPSTDELLRSAALDKKRREGRQNLVLLREAGDVVTGCEVSPSALRAAIEGVRGGGEAIRP